MNTFVKHFHPKQPFKKHYHFHGHCMFELFSVVINEIKGDHIEGQIIIETNEQRVVIYDGGEGKIGEPLLLRSPTKAFLAYDPISILFSIRPEELMAWKYVCVPDSNPSDGVITKEIVVKGWGKVTLSFQLFSCAVDAHVDVMFLGKADDYGKMKYPSHVYGEIYATCCGMTETKVVLFQRKSKEEAEALENGEPIPLSRSVIAAQLGAAVFIHGDLWGCFDSSDIRTTFCKCFNVKSYSRTDEMETDDFYDSPVKMKVTWVDRPPAQAPQPFVK